MDKIFVIFSLVGVAVWLSHTAAKKRGKSSERSTEGVRLIRLRTR